MHRTGQIKSGLLERLTYSDEELRPNFTEGTGASSCYLYLALGLIFLAPTKNHLNYSPQCFIMYILGERMF